MTMNRNQLIVLWCTIAMIALMCLYVPWHQSATVFKLSDGMEYPRREEDCGYGLIFLLKGGQRLDLVRMGIQCGLVAVIAVGLIVTFTNPVKRP